MLMTWIIINLRNINR